MFASVSLLSIVFLLTLKESAFYKFRNKTFKIGTFRSEFPSVNGTHCCQIVDLGLFCSEFLSVNGIHCSQNDNLGLFCSKVLSVNGTICSHIDNLGIFVPSSLL